MFVLLHKWGDTAATSDLTLGAICSLPGVKIKPKTMQTVVFAFARGSQVNLKSRCQHYPKKSDIWAFSPHFLLNYFPIFSVEGHCSWHCQLWCGVRVRWCLIMSFVPFAGIERCQRATWRATARPRRSMDDAKLKTFHKNPASWKGGEEWRCMGRVEVCVEGTAVTGGLATTVGITLLSVITCCGEVVSFLLWCGSDLKSCPKLWHVFVFL